MAIHPPQATVTGYTLTPYTVSTSIDTLLTVIEFSFERKMIWTTLSQIFADQGFETMPQQEVEAYEFVLHKPNATASEIAALESFLDAHFGAAVPFHFTAPDDSVVYSVQFKEDKLQYGNPAAGYTPVLFTLVTAGDVAGTLDNSLVYPSYITLSPGPGTSSGGGGGGGGPEPATGTVRTNLIAEYLMVGGSGTTITDTSGNGNTATLGIAGSTIMQAQIANPDTPISGLYGFAYQSPTWIDNGLSFNGSSILTLADGSIVSTSTTTFSAEMWLYPLSIGSGDAVYFNFGFSDYVIVDAGNPSAWRPFYIDAVGGGGAIFYTTDGTFSTHPWGTGPYQIVLVRDPVAGDMLAYVNGQLATHTNLGAPSAFSPTTMEFDSSFNGAPFDDVRLIGNDMFPPGGFHGVLSEVRFYSSALSSADVLQNFDARKAFYGLS